MINNYTGSASITGQSGGGGGVGSTTAGNKVGGNGSAGYVLVVWGE